MNSTERIEEPKSGIRMAALKAVEMQGRDRVGARSYEMAAVFLAKELFEIEKVAK